MVLIEKNEFLPLHQNYKGRRFRNYFTISLSKFSSQWLVLLMVSIFFIFPSLTSSDPAIRKTHEQKVMTSISPLTTFSVFYPTIQDKISTLEETQQHLSSTQFSHEIVNNEAGIEHTEMNNGNMFDKFNSGSKIGSLNDKHQLDSKQWGVMQQPNVQKSKYSKNRPNEITKHKKTFRIRSPSDNLETYEDFRVHRLSVQNGSSNDEEADTDYSFYNKFNNHKKSVSMEYFDDIAHQQTYENMPEKIVSVPRSEGIQGVKCPPALMPEDIEWRKRNRVVMAFLPYMEPSTCDPPVKCSISTTVNRHIYLQDGDSLEVMIQRPPDFAPSPTLSTSFPLTSTKLEGANETNGHNKTSSKAMEPKKFQTKQTTEDDRKEDSRGKTILLFNDSKNTNTSGDKKRNASSDSATKVNSTMTYLIGQEDRQWHSLGQGVDLLLSSPRGKEKLKRERKKRRAATAIADRGFLHKINNDKSGESSREDFTDQKTLKKTERTKRLAVKRNVISGYETDTPGQIRETVMTTRPPLMSLSLTIWKVTKTEWSSCSTREGGQVAESSEDGVATIPRESLPAGDNYFIGRSSWSSSDCFKLMVKVRTSDCGEGSICSGKGICYANETMEEYECSCCRGYTGRHCEERNACTDSPCLNAGYCLDIEEGHDGDAFQCLCPYGYRGRLCETPTSLCDSNPCQNGGFCEGNHTSYSCRCSPGWTGLHCLEESSIFATEELKQNDEIEIPFIDDSLKTSSDKKLGEGCTHGPCVHGVCVETTSQGYRCFCLPGFGGNRCEMEYNECFSNPCQNGGTCIDQIGNFQCLCAPGYTGPYCMTKVNMCIPDPCPPNRICIDKGHSHLCKCVQELSDDCGIHEEICDPNPCAHGGTCYPISETLSFYCACRPGFTGQTCHGKDHHIRMHGHDSDLKPTDLFGGNPSDQIESSVYEEASILESVGPYGTAKPVRELVLPHSSFSSNGFTHMRKLYTGAVTLACAFMIFLLVVSICHCRVNRPYNKCSIPLARPSLRFLPSVTRGRSSFLRDKKRRNRSSSIRMEQDPDGASPSMTSYSNADSVFYNMDACDNQELPLIK